MPYSDATGLRIYYEAKGEGPAMLLVHANPFNHDLWLYQIARFSTRFRVIAPDLRNYGRSGRTTEPFGLADMADDMLGVLRAEGADSAIVAGISVGSAIAMAIGLDHPEVVRALILVGGASARPAAYDGRIAGYEGGDFAAYQRRHIAECFAPGFAETGLGAYLAELFAAWAPRLDGRGIAEVFRARGAAHLTPRLGEIAVPTLVVNGEHDMSLADGRLTASLIPGCRHAVLPGTGHCCNIEDPAAFDAAVTAFLADNGLWPEP